ncbi:MAG: N-acetylmuramoyl-L-alanine amidase [Lachnospiraceae bacterium]|nr:N-acetylmuramoyl-L-alanine amidase [Lachnospiraceae bacterium]
MSSNNRRMNTNVISKIINSGKRAVAGVLSFVMEKWNSLHRETKKVFGISLATGLVLLVAVIVLAVRLGNVTKELDSVQTMSTNLQQELDRVTNEMENALQKSPVTEAIKPTSVPTMVATVTPMPTATPEPDKYVVCIDAGHGDWDGGAVKTVNGVEVRVEKDDNLRMAMLLREALKAYDIEVVMTRDTDVYLGLSERAQIANAAGADVLISLHRNAYAGTAEVQGVEYWIHNSRPADAESLAQKISAEVVKVGGMVNRGVKYGTIASSKENYAINREANMASMIIELGFISSEADNAALDEYGEDYAKGMAKAVYEWLEEQVQTQ